MKSQKVRNPFKIPSAKAADQPATRKMLSLVRNELRSEIRALDLKVDSGFEKMDATLQRMDLRLEEQNANNRIVLEGLQLLWQRQERTDTRLERLERAR
jgi:hypothetical protein